MVFTGFMGGSIWRAKSHTCYWLCVEIFCKVFHHVEDPLLHHCNNPMWHSSCFLLGMLLRLCGISARLANHATDQEFRNWVCRIQEDHEDLLRCLLRTMLRICWFSIQCFQKYNTKYKIDRTMTITSRIRMVLILRLFSQLVAYYKSGIYLDVSRPFSDNTIKRTKCTHGV